MIAGPDQVGMQAKLMGMAGQLGIADRVHWPGLIGGDVKWGALRACDALILPSHQENLGISVVEALAVGRPVLISHQVNIWQEIESDGAGLAEDDTLEGTVRLLCRWFDLLPADAPRWRPRAALFRRAVFHEANGCGHQRCVWSREVGRKDLLGSARSMVPLLGKRHLIPDACLDVRPGYRGRNEYALSGCSDSASGGMNRNPATVQSPINQRLQAVIVRSLNVS